MAIILAIKWQYIFNPELAIKSIPQIMQGMQNTLTISFVSFCMAVVGGLVLAICRLAKWRILRWFAIGYTSLFRGVPLIVTLFFIYFGLPLMGIVLDAVIAAIIGMGLTASAYTAEIIRAAIEGIDVGQWEAAYAIGLNYRQSLQYVIVPQASRIAIPPLSNVMLDMVKSSSIAAMITVPEIFMKAKAVGAAEHDFMTLYIVVALIYWVICSLYAVFQAQLERYFAQYK